MAPLNRDWWYSGPLADDAPAPALDDPSGFERVTLPHANVRLPWHGFDEGAFQFVSEYRRGLTLPESLRGRRVFLDFDGVMTAHTVSLNGTALEDYQGEYRGGYLPSTFEAHGPSTMGSAEPDRRVGGLDRARRHPAVRRTDRLPDVRRDLP